MQTSSKSDGSIQSSFSIAIQNGIHGGVAQQLDHSHNHSGNISSLATNNYHQQHQMNSNKINNNKSIISKNTALKTNTDATANKKMGNNSNNFSDLVNHGNLSYFDPNGNCYYENDKVEHNGHNNNAHVLDDDEEEEEGRGEIGDEFEFYDDEEDSDKEQLFPSNCFNFRCQRVRNDSKKVIHSSNSSASNKKTATTNNNSKQSSNDCNKEMNRISSVCNNLMNRCLNYPTLDAQSYQTMDEYHENINCVRSLSSNTTNYGNNNNNNNNTNVINSHQEHHNNNNNNEDQINHFLGNDDFNSDDLSDFSITANDQYLNMMLLGNTFNESSSYHNENSQATNSLFQHPHTLTNSQSLTQQQQPQQHQQQFQHYQHGQHSNNQPVSVSLSTKTNSSIKQNTTEKCNSTSLVSKQTLKQRKQQNNLGASKRVSKTNTTRAYKKQASNNDAISNSGATKNNEYDSNYLQRLQSDETRTRENGTPKITTANTNRRLLPKKSTTTSNGANHQVAPACTLAVISNKKQKQSTKSTSSQRDVSSCGLSRGQSNEIRSPNTSATVKILPSTQYDANTSKHFDNLRKKLIIDSGAPINQIIPPADDANKNSQKQQQKILQGNNSKNKRDEAQRIEVLMTIQDRSLGQDKASTNSVCQPSTNNNTKRAPLEHPRGNQLLTLVSNANNISANQRQVVTCINPNGQNSNLLNSFFLDGDFNNSGLNNITNNNNINQQSLSGMYRTSDGRLTLVTTSGLGPQVANQSQLNSNHNVQFQYSQQQQQQQIQQNTNSTTTINDNNIIDTLIDLVNDNQNTTNSNYAFQTNPSAAPNQLLHTANAGLSRETSIGLSNSDQMEYNSWSGLHS